MRGKASFEAELRHAGVDPDILQNAEILPVILKKVSFECLDDMYAAIWVRRSDRCEGCGPHPR